MASTLTTETDFYLFVFPAIFGVVFAFVFGLGVYQCATASRVKATYRNRNRVLQSRLSHSLAYCDRHDITSVYETLRDYGYSDLCDMPDDESRSSGSRHSHRKSKSSARERSSEESGDSPDRRGHHSRTPSQRHRPSNARSQRSGTSNFVLDEVNMIDSDEEYSYES